MSRQCELLGLSRASYYRQPKKETAKNLELMRRIDEIYTAYPFYGSRKIRDHLRRMGYKVNRKRVQRLMGEMGLVGGGAQEENDHLESFSQDLSIFTEEA